MATVAKESAKGVYVPKRAVKKHTSMVNSYLRKSGKARWFSWFRERFRVGAANVPVSSVHNRTIAKNLSFASA